MTLLKARQADLERVTSRARSDPGAALRELIANAWDADARDVVMRMDPPNCSAISISDDGNGMSAERLRAALQRLGRQRPRTGAARSAGGRPVIGRHGLGLFAATRLARRMTIRSRDGSGSGFEAELRLLEPPGGRSGPEAAFGELRIGALAGSEEPSGTVIVLEDVLPEVREKLTGAGEAAAPLRWSADTPSTARMAELVAAAETALRQAGHPDLEKVLDPYSRMIWSLGISTPVGCVGPHPFDAVQQDGLRLYWIGGADGVAQEVGFPAGETVREAVRRRAAGNPRLVDGAGAERDFRVEVDGIELRRPVRIEGGGTLFVGRTLAGEEGYLHWREPMGGPGADIALLRQLLARIFPPVQPPAPREPFNFILWSAAGRIRCCGGSMPV